MGLAQNNFGANLSDNVLGTVLIILALLTELGVISIIYEEADKLDAAIDYAFNNIRPIGKFNGGNNVLGEIAEVNESVADVLKELCCLKEAVIKEIKLGIFLRNRVSFPALDVK